MRMIYSFFLIIVFGCNEVQTDKSQFKTYFDTASRFGISNHKLHQKLTDALNLSHIDEGADSFELRLWSDLVITDLETVTILKYSNSSWKLNELQYWSSIIGDLGKHSDFVIDCSITKRKIPKLSFEQVIDSIKSFRLDTIITQQDIPNFMDKTADGISYTIEISSKSYYRRISYSNPSYYTDSYNKQISNFLKFMGRNLGAFVLE